MMIRSFIFTLCIFTSSYCEFPFTFNQENGMVTDLSPKEESLISHLNKSIEAAKKNASKISRDVLRIPGMSSARNRHLLNNICQLQECVYFEIGSWKGSTLISALYKNQAYVKDAIAIDNWSEMGGPRKAFHQNCAKYLKKEPFRFYEEDCFSIDLCSTFPDPVNIYFYDGHHSVESQKLGFTYFNPIFDDVFIAIVDDWEWDNSRQGTFEAFHELGYTVLKEEALLGKDWWNGLYLAVIRK